MNASWIIVIVVVGVAVIFFGMLIWTLDAEAHRTEEYHRSLDREKKDENCDDWDDPRM